ncbi:MAG TPA: sugar ABC transporter permease [Spirochaetia bacterium]|nr:sugar ABC transporter permease [Spirochaetia bacterium]
MKERGAQLRAWLFVLPALILLAAYLVYPTIQTFRLSFFGGTGFNPTRFVGLRNYVQLLSHDSLFLSVTHWPPSGALVNNILWLVLFSGGTLVFGLLIAVLASGLRVERIAKSTVFLPMVISATAAAVIARFLFSPDPSIGLLNAVLTSLVPGLKPVSWLGTSEVVNYALIATGVWIWTGLSMTVLSAAYKSIDPAVLEAARVDGAGPWKTFWRVTLPMLAQPVSFVAITMIINSLKMLDLVLVMTAGGPAGASRVIGFTFYWEVFNNNLVGYGSAVAILMLVSLIPLMAVQVRRIRRQERGA